MSLRSIPECLHSFSTTAVSGSSNLAVAGVTGNRIYVYRIIVTVLTAGTVTIASDATALSQPFQLAATGALTLDTPINFDPWWVTNKSSANNNSLNILQSGVTSLCFDVWYLQGP